MDDSARIPRMLDAALTSPFAEARFQILRQEGWSCPEDADGLLRQLLFLRGGVRGGLRGLGYTKLPSRGGLSAF